jgi:uncharacterized membrane protein YdjX (TVP38/TMEM64 family)
LENVNSVVSALRTVFAAVLTTVAQMPIRRAVGIVAAIVILVAIAVWVPLPSAVQMRDWATSVGPWFPLAFLAAHTLVTVLPFPRTAFTLAAGLLFGPALGVTLAVVASTLSALIALWLVRVLGWHLSKLSHKNIDVLDARLKERGWATIAAMRLIPAMPFSVLNYAAGASSVRVLPYTLATFFGLLPGTAAVVILGDALTGQIRPSLLVVSFCTASIGIAGLIYEIRLHRRAAHAAATPDVVGSTSP